MLKRISISSKHYQKILIKNVHYYFFLLSAYIILENGFGKKGKEDGLDLSDKLVPKIKVFYSVKEYTDTYTIFNRLEMENFTFICVFFSVWFLLLVIFIVHLTTRRVLLLVMDINIQIYYNRFLDRYFLIRKCRGTNRKKF